MNIKCIYLRTFVIIFLSIWGLVPPQITLAQTNFSFYDSLFEVVGARNSDSARIIVNEMKKKANLARDKHWQGIVRLRLSEFDFEVDKYDVTIREGLQVIDYFKTLKDTIGLAESYLFLTLIMNDLKKYKEAKYYIVEGLGYASTTKNFRTWLKLKGLNAYLFAVEHKYDTARKEYSDLLEIIENSSPANYQKNKDLIATIYANLGNMQFNNKNFYQASIYLKKALEFNRGAIDQMVYTYFDLARVTHLLGDSLQANKYVNNALHLLVKNPVPYLLKEGYRRAAQFFVEKQNYKKAYIALNLLKNLNDSLSGANEKKLAIELEKRYQTDKKTLENKTLILENEKAVFKQYISFLITSIALLACALIFIFYKNKVVIEKENAEKIKMKLDILSKEQRFKAQELILQMEKEANLQFQYENSKKKLQIQELENINLRLEKENYEKEVCLKNNEIEQLSLMTLRIQNENMKAEVEINKKNLEISTLLSISVKRNDILKHIKAILGNIKEKSLEIKLIHKDIDALKKLEESTNSEQNKFDDVNHYFFERLKAISTELTQNDLRICAFSRMNLSIKEIAELTSKSVSAVEGIRWRIRKKLNLSEKEVLNDFLKEIPLFNGEFK